MQGAPGASPLQLWPLLWVRDFESTIDFWTTGLGFEVVGSDGEPGRRGWCRLERGGASVMLQQSARRGDGAPIRREPERTTLYFVCDDVDSLHQELLGRGLELSDPVVAEYRMKQLRIPEPNGHEVWFESPVP